MQYPDATNAAVADSPAAEVQHFIGESGWAIEWHDPRSGKYWDFAVDFAALTATLEEKR